MDFFNVGFVLCAFSLNIGLELNYITRIVGALFMLGGIHEFNTGFGDRRFAKHSYTELGLLLIAGGGLAQALLTRYGVITPGTGNILSIIFGALCTAVVVADQYLMLGKILPDHSFVNDPSLLARLGKVWKPLAAAGIASVIAEICGRVLPNEEEAAYVGVLLVFSRLFMYIYLVITAVAFNRCRMDFNKMHPLRNGDE